MRHVCDLYFNIRLNDVSLQMKPIWVTFISIIKLMGGRLPAVAGMPANRTFLELSAGQSDWPEIICVVLLPKKRRRPVSFRHEEKRFSLWTAPCLSI